MTILSNEQFKERVAELQSRSLAAQQCIGALDPALHAGDVVILNSDVSLNLRWVLTSLAENNHSDQQSQLWYICAVDDVEIIGTSDVEVTATDAAAAMVVRCASCVQVVLDTANVKDMRIGRLSESSLSLVCEKLDDIKNGFEFLAPERLAVDRDKEYQGRIKSIAIAAQSLADALAVNTACSSTKRLDPNKPYASQIITAVETFLQSCSLTAATPLVGLRAVSNFGIGLMKSAIKSDPPLLAATADQMFVADAEDIEAELRIAIVYESLEYFLVAFQYRDAVALQSVGVSLEDEPEVLVVDEAGLTSPVSWKQTSPGIFQSVPLLPWLNDRIRLQVSAPASTLTSVMETSDLPPTSIVFRAAVTQELPVSVVQPTKRPRRRWQKEIWKQPAVIRISLVSVIGVLVLVISMMSLEDPDPVATKTESADQGVIDAAVESPKRFDPPASLEPFVNGLFPEGSVVTPLSPSYDLGVSYRRGEGVPQNYKEAMKWFRIGAEQGKESSQHNLGAMYALGEGVPINNKEAYVWFSLAAISGYKPSQEALEEIKEKLSPEQLVEAQEQVTVRFKQIKEAQQ